MLDDIKTYVDRFDDPHENISAFKLLLRPYHALSVFGALYINILSHLLRKSTLAMTNINR